jgi:hypothetical protein
MDGSSAATLRQFAETKGYMTATRISVLGLVLLCVACGTTSPSTGATSVQVFSGALAVHGRSTYPFNVAPAAPVNVTLASLTDSASPFSTLTTTVGLAIGTPDSSGGCTHTTEMMAAPGLTAQISNPSTMGAHCVDVYDIGNLAGSVNFGVRITIAPSSNASATAVTETFGSNLAILGTAIRSFVVMKAGTISITLTTLTTTAQVGLGLGIPRSDGTGCLLYTSLNTAAGTAAQITSNAETGTYCVEVYDVGNLTLPTTFSGSIAHP